MGFMIKGVAVIAWMGALLCALIYANHGVSAYEEGGAPEFVFSAESSNSTKNCYFATLQGRREYQEDRVVCNLDLKLPFSDERGLEETAIGIAAIFDGHGGDETSEMASAMLFNSFLMNVAFAAYKPVLQNNKSHCSSVLEEALLRTIRDIDSEFSKVALDKGYISGSTGTIALLLRGQFLVANVGDSKAILCSKKGGEVYAEEVTRDHHPDREDEKARIKAAGGFITRRGVPRVNGILALSRAIGDVYLKRYGVTAEAEITGWRGFTPENRYLVVASDGVFETLTPKNVCDLLLHYKASAPPSELPEWIIQYAFGTGSTDNLSAVVIAAVADVV